MPVPYKHHEINKKIAPLNLYFNEKTAISVKKSLDTPFKCYKIY